MGQSMEDTTTDNTVYDLELDRIKAKVIELYSALLMKTFKSANPGGSSDDLEDYLDANEIKFAGDDDFDSGAAEIEQLLNSFLDTEELEKVSEKSYDKPTVATGATPVAHNEAPKAPKTTKVDIQEGMFRKAPQKKEEISSQKIVDPTGQKIGKKATDDGLKRSTRDMRELWEKERDRLLNLIHRRKRVVGFWA